MGAAEGYWRLGNKISNIGESLGRMGEDTRRHELDKTMLGLKLPIYKAQGMAAQEQMKEMEDLDTPANFSPFVKGLWPHEGYAVDAVKAVEANLGGKYDPNTNTMIVNGRPLTKRDLKRPDIQLAVALGVGSVDIEDYLQKEASLADKYAPLASQESMGIGPDPKQMEYYNRGLAAKKKMEDPIALRTEEIKVWSKLLPFAASNPALAKQIETKINFAGNRLTKLEAEKEKNKPKYTVSSTGQLIKVTGEGEASATDIPGYKTKDKFEKPQIVDGKLIQRTVTGEVIATPVKGLENTKDAKIVLDSFANDMQWNSPMSDKDRSAMLSSRVKLFQEQGIITKPKGEKVEGGTSEIDEFYKAVGGNKKTPQEKPVQSKPKPAQPSRPLVETGKPIINTGELPLSERFTESFKKKEEPKPKKPNTGPLTMEQISKLTDKEFIVYMEKYPAAKAAYRAYRE